MLGLYSWPLSFLVGVYYSGIFSTIEVITFISYLLPFLKLMASRWIRTLKSMYFASCYVEHYCLLWLLSMDDHVAQQVYVVRFIFSEK